MKTRRALSLLLLMACSDEGGPIALEKMPAELRRVLCEKVYSCCTPAERMANPLIGHDVASCITALPNYATFLLGDFADSVAKGRASYDAEKMGKCLAALDKQSCAQLKSPLEGVDVGDVCEDVLQPKVAVGSPCSEYWDCVGGWCEGDAGGLMDRCTALKADGAECDESPECASGSCHDGTCVKHEPEGGNLCKLGMESD
jgi:hypothetical protein